MERMVPGDPKVEPHFLDKIFVEHINRYHAAAAYIKGKRTLDLGCGVGYGSAFLYEKGAGEVFGIDRSSEAIEYATKHYSREKVSFTVQDAAKLAFSQSYFDVVVSFELIEHVNDPEAVMREVRRVLKAEGLLIISTPRSHGRLRSEFHIKEFLFAEFRELIEKHFKNTQAYLQNPCFVNLIEPRHPPEQPEFKLHKLASFDASNSDTFLIVASDGAIPLGQAIFFTVADDSYVAYLEREREILKKDWEDKEVLIRGLRSRIAELEGGYAELKERYYAEMQKIQVSLENLASEG